jgi:molybdate transport system substrate-binding protein
LDVRTKRAQASDLRPGGPGNDYGGNTSSPPVVCRRVSAGSCHRAASPTALCRLAVPVVANCWTLAADAKSTESSMLKHSLYTAVATLVFVSSADAAEIKLLSSNAVKEAFSELIPQFEKATGHRVNVLWGGTLDVKGRVESGEVADLVITPSADIDNMIASGKLVPRSRVDLVTSIIGVAVRSGLTKPDVSSGEKLKVALFAANSIIISSGPSGFYLLDLFEREGILPVLRPKMKQLAPGQSVGEALARNEGDLGFTQVSELLHVKSINYVGPLSPDVQKVTVFSAGVLKNSLAAAAATELLTFLRNPVNASVLKKAGLEPAR